MATLTKNCYATDGEKFLVRSYFIDPTAAADAASSVCACAESIDIHLINTTDSTAVDR